MSQPQNIFLEPEYAKINDNFRFLADVRFKLLAFLPTLGGIAVFVLSGVGLQAGQAPTLATPELLAAVLLVSLLGFLATLGITLYDQRNSELYNALIHRAKYLETQFGAPGAPGGPLLGDWFFPMLCAALFLLGVANQKAVLAAAGAAVIAAIGFTLRLIVFDRQEMEQYKLAAERAGLDKKEAWHV